MSYDMGRINNIENQLKSNPNGLSTNDLIYYLKYNSKNKILDANNLDNTGNYLKKINNSFFYENIFVNTGNYTGIVAAIIGLLIPFYYFYPRFYKIGFIAVFIGLFSLYSLYSLVNSLYSNFFTNISNIFIGLTISIYIIFFVVLNKLNHYTLLFISAIIAFVLINYIMRVIITVPSKKNPYSQFRANMNNNTDYTQYNVLIETTCFQVMSRFKLTLPSGNMLYSYLTVFDIGDNSSKIQDFLTNLLSPLISIIIIFILGTFLYKLKNESISNIPIHLFPVLGMDNNSSKLVCCQANYILPQELNVDLLIENLLIQYNFNDTVYVKVQKALLRVSHELLKKFNPKFMLLDNVDTATILNNLKNNKIFIRINKYLNLNLNNVVLNFDYLDEIRKLIEENKNIPLQQKENIFNLLDKIDNTLLIINKENVDYSNDVKLAKDELLYDKDIDNSVKPLLKDIVDKFIKNYTDNLHLKDGKLYGYDYNIITYSLFGKNSVAKKIKLFSNKIFTFILRLISSWLILAKPIGSPLLIVRYIMTQSNGVKHLMNNISENSIIWKYFSMGFDYSYFEDVYKNIKNNKEESILTEGLNIIYSILIFILLFPIFYMYNSICFGLTLSPSWYNPLYQFVFIANIVGNLYTYNSKGSILFFNIKFLIAFIIIFLLISVITYVLSLIKK
jgi:hypothetical protein